MATHSIKRGENLLIRKNLLQADGSPLLLADLAGAVVHLKHTVKSKQIILKTYEYGSDPELRAGTTTSQLEFELPMVTSAELPLGSIIAEFVLDVNDVNFHVDSASRNIIRQDTIAVAE